jgi:nitroreductase
MSRRSVRKYRETPVSAEILRDLVEFAATAPSGSNCQNWEFTIIPDRNKVFQLAWNIRDFFVRLNAIVRNPVLRYVSVLFAGTALLRYYRDHFASVEQGLTEAEKGRDLLFHGAPALIIVHSDMEGSLPLEDGQYAAYNIVLMAHAMGLGTCFIGYASETLNKSKKIKTSINIPEKNRVLAVLTVGYPDISYERFALRKDYCAEFI